MWKYLVSNLKNMGNFHPLEVNATHNLKWEKILIV